MSFSGRQLLSSGPCRSILNLFRSAPTNRGSPDEKDEEPTEHGSAQKAPPQRAEHSNRCKSKPHEARRDLLSENSNPVPRLGKRKSPSDAFEEEIAELKRRLGSRDKTIAGLRSREAQLEANMAELEGYYEKEQERLEVEKEDQEEQFLAMQEEMGVEVQRLTDEQQDCEEQLRKAQEGAFRQMKAGRWAPREDSSIRSDLQKLEGKIRNWARTESCADLGCFDSLSSEEMAQIEDILHESVCASTQSLPTAVNSWPAKRKAPMLLVHAVIAKIVFQEIFGRPFYFFDENLSTSRENLICRPQYSPSFGTDLEGLYARMQRMGHQDAHVWRSQTLRLLRSQKNDAHVEEEDEVEGMSNAVCKALAKIILDGPVFKLCRKVNEEEQKKRQQDLTDLFKDAGELAQELWTQRTYMEIVDIHSLERFQVDSPHMAAHRLQKLDEDDPRLDGHEILAVIQPALVAYGNDDGENYEESKVWSKAIVLVEE